MQVKQQCNVNIWHVGSRGGYTPFDFPPGLDSVFSITLFDESGGAPASISIGGNGRTTQARTRFIPAIFWSEQGVKPFYETKCPYASGLKPINEKYSSWYVYGNPNIDYILGKAGTPSMVRDVAVTTLDSISHSYSCASPSVLVIDAQGSTYEILLGAEQLLADEVDFIIAEVELLPFFEQTPSFAQILPYLVERDFLFAKFLPESNPWASPIRVALGRRSAPLMGSADAIFMRDPAKILISDNLHRRVRYVIACLCLGFVDIASHILSNSPDWKIAEGDLEPAGRELLKQFADALAEMPKVFPPAFGDTVSPHLDRGISEFLGRATTPLEEFLELWSMGAVAQDLRTRRKEQMQSLQGIEGR